MKKYRRSVSLDNDLRTAINRYRGKHMIETMKDKTFTKAINELLREILTQKNFLPLKEAV